MRRQTDDVVARIGRGTGRRRAGRRASTGRSKIVVLHAGEAEEGLDSEPAQRVDHQVGDGAGRSFGHGCHV
jgi:hypothetical protein